MADRNRTFAVIPARSGSKGLPRKNLLTIAGRSLLQIAVDAARDSEQFDQIIVSSDGVEILAAARALGVTAVERPLALAADTSRTAAAIAHVIASCGLMAEDVIALLQPTSPLRTATHVRDALAAHRSSGKPVVSVDSTPLYPDKYLAMTPDGCVTAINPGSSTLPRQELHAAFKPNGAIYVFTTGDFNRVGDVPVDGAAAFMMDKLTSIDIDDATDLRLAELLLENRHVFDRRP